MWQTCTLGTQYKSSQLDHFIDGVGILGCMNLTFTSKFSVETSIIIPTQYFVSYKHEIVIAWWNCIPWHKYMNNIEAKLNDIVLIIWNIFCTYNWIRYCNELMKGPGPGTVSALLYISSIFTLMLPISWFFKNKK